VGAGEEGPGEDGEGEDGAGTAAAWARAALPPRTFQATAAPAPTATMSAAPMAANVHADALGLGIAVLMEAYEVFGVCYDGPVGPDV
jgi:hypothetical protein